MRRYIFWAIIFVSFLGNFSAHALTQIESMDGVEVTVYAPDWIWQKSLLNILVTLENSSEESLECVLEINLPEEFADHFVYGNTEVENTTITIPAGESVRHAFTNIEASGGVDLQTYDFSVDATINGATVVFEYPLTTIRGPVVSTAQWALFLPVIICVLWCGAFVVALRRFAEPGAWRRASESTHDSADEAWMDEMP